MDENRVNILNASNRILSKLHLMAAFFAHDIIYKVYLRSQVIHQLFEGNAELDINKLELFHLQFTATLVELLRKIKKSNEKNVSLLLDEMQLNTDLIAKLQSETLTEADFNLEKQRQALKINTSLRQLYQALSNNSSEYPFAKNINAFSARFAPGFYASVSGTLLAGLTNYEPAEVYTNAHAVIQRKLLGLVNKYDFKSQFYCGLKAGALIIEVYYLPQPRVYFIFYPSRNLFLLCDEAELSAINHSIDEEKSETLLQELQNKNDQLQSSIAVAKTSLPDDICHLLNEHYKKISDIDFIQNISNFDAQANILKSMLNTDMM